MICNYCDHESKGQCINTLMYEGGAWRASLLLKKPFISSDEQLFLTCSPELAECDLFEPRTDTQICRTCGGTGRLPKSAQSENKKRSQVWAAYHDGQPAITEWYVGSHVDAHDVYRDDWEWKVGICRAMSYPSGWYGMRVYMGTERISWHSTLCSAEGVDGEILYFHDLRWSSKFHLRAVPVCRRVDDVSGAVMDRLRNMKISDRIAEVKKEVKDWKALKKGDLVKAFLC